MLRFPNIVRPVGNVRIAQTQVGGLINRFTPCMIHPPVEYSSGQLARVSSRPRAVAGWLVFGVLVVSSAGCASKATQSSLPQLWAVAPGSPPPAATTQFESPYYNRNRNVIQIVGGVREVTAFTLGLSAGEAAAVGIEILTEPFEPTFGAQTVTALDASTKPSTPTTPPPAPIPASSVRLFRHWPITVNRYSNWYLRAQGLREPREIPDALVPLDARNFGQPLTIRPGTSLALWVEVRIPPDARPGTYLSGLTLRDAAGHVSRVPIELRVLDVYPSTEDLLPVPARVQLGPLIAALSEYDPADPRIALADVDVRRQIEQAFAMLHDHGLSPYTDEIRPGFAQDSSGAVQLDWSLFDDFCGPLIGGEAFADGRGAAYWPLPIDLAQPNPLQFDGMDSAMYAGVLKDAARRTAAHFTDRGWFARSFLYFDLPKAENPSKADVDQVRHVARLLREAGVTAPFSSCLVPQSMTPFGWYEHVFEDLSDVVRIWRTPARYEHARTVRELRARGSQAWLRPDRPPYSGSLAVEAPVTHARSLPWQAFLRGNAALDIDRATDWPPRVLDEPITEPRQRSDSWLIYPGRMFGLNEPIPSVRLKQLQLGLQDYQHLKLMERHGRGETARLLASSLIKAAGTDAYGDNFQDGLFARRVDDPAMWDLAQRILIEELEAALAEESVPGAGDADGSRKGRINALWEKFLASTRRLECWPESQRIRYDAEADGGAYVLSCDVAVRSELRVPVTGTLRFAGLPLSAEAVADQYRIGPMDEMDVVRRQLTARLPALPPRDLDGHFLQPVVFDAGFLGRTFAVCAVSMVRAPRAVERLVIDGNLSDWRPAELNAAGDFRRINKSADARDDLPESAYGAPGATPVEPRPRAESQTVVYFSRDDQYLYIGLHSAAPQAESAAGLSRPARFSNVVEYEDLMPRDADLVEILLDPTNLATRSDDLFHLVIKAEGGAVFERGVGIVPPVGRSAPWPGAAPQYAVARTAFGWSAEVAIAIDALGPAARTSPVWGVNLARFEPIRGEYSDWARAPRYGYDPRTFGNLIWIEPPLPAERSSRDE